MTLPGIQIHPALPNLMPGDPTARLIVFVIRRMAIGGVRDAHAGHALFGAFGMKHRRVQIFMRVLMTEFARASTVTITVAPPCCQRLTRDEHDLLGIIATAAAAPQIAHQLLTVLLGNADCRAPLAAAIGFSDVLSDLGCPLSCDV